MVIKGKSGIGKMPIKYKTKDGNIFYIMKIFIRVPTKNVANKIKEKIKNKKINIDNILYSLEFIEIEKFRKQRPVIINDLNSIWPNWKKELNPSGILARI